MDAYNESLSRQIFDVARLHRNHAAALLADIGLYAGQENVLKILAEGERTMTGLAEALRVAGPTATKMVSRLMAAGVVACRGNANDARQIWVSLTSEGRKRADQIDDVWRKLDDTAFKSFTPEDRKRFREFLNHMRGNLEAENSAVELEEVAA